MIDFQKGDPDGFRILFQKYTKKIITFCYRFCGDQALAEELAQEVFLRIYKAAPRYRAEARFSTWLFRIATNVCLNETRKARHHVAIESIDGEPRAESGRPGRQIGDSITPDPEAMMGKKAERKEIQQALQKLPENQRIALWLRVYEEFSYQEIGKQMNQTESAVKSLIHRARQALVGRISKP